MLLIDTFNADDKVVLSDKVLKAITFNVLQIVVLLHDVINPGTFNADNNVVLLDINVHKTLSLF
jgi:hypothetical protein